MDPYVVLGVAPGAPAEEVRRAYLREARRHHPDRHHGSSPAERAEAERRMREVNDAWSLLRDGRAAVAEPPPQPFVPFSEEEDPDPREQPDVPYRPAAPPKRGRALVPVLLFGASVVVGMLGAFLRMTGVLAVAGTLFLLSCVGFLVVPLLVLGEARRDD